MDGWGAAEGKEHELLVFGAGLPTSKGSFSPHHSLRGPQPAPRQNSPLEKGCGLPKATRVTGCLPPLLCLGGIARISGHP